MIIAWQAPIAGSIFCRRKMERAVVFPVLIPDCAWATKSLPFENVSSGQPFAAFAFTFKKRHESTLLKSRRLLET
jgi:hypothetical protein